MKNEFTPENSRRGRDLASEREKFMGQFADQSVAVEAEWLKTLMRRLLPESIFKMANSKNRAQIKRSVIFLAENKIHIAHHPDKTVLMHGDRPIGEFKVEFKEGKPFIVTRFVKNINRLPEP